MSASDAVLAARGLLQSLTPLKTDCGRLCGCACCRGDEQTGMLLFPGEDALYAGCSFARVLPASFCLGGQQARLALARTLRHKRPLLILDDPFSAVDMTTEGEIMEHLRALAGGNIILLLSHRLDRSSELDGVLWMEHGTVLAGSHQELMETCPAYASLYTAQKGGDHHGTAG